MNLAALLNQSAYDFYFLVVDRFLDIDVPQLSNFYSLSPEKLNITLEEKNSGRLLSHPKTIEFITRNSAKTGRIPAVVPFKPSAKIDFICQNKHWLLVSNPSSINRFLEDKIKFTEFCQSFQLPIVPNLVLPFNETNYSRAQNNFGSKLVIQTHFGWAGNSSYLSNNWSDIYSKIFPGTPVKFSPFLEGYSLINNCCFTNKGLLQSPPGLQYTGISSLTKNPLATVGRQWPAPAPTEIISQVKKITDDFSRPLQDLHYQGFFGLDFLVSKDHVYLLECNPRLTASFAFYTQIEINLGLNPLFYFHLADFIHLDYPFDLFTEQNRFFHPQIIGSELTLKDSRGTTTKKYQEFKAFSSTCHLTNFDSQILSHLL